ncbi:DUF4209 domain-containing protein [Agrobacterium tumefaciens]|uniref:DUF4209 domain-containing protein n=1 Tax=Agrobacterium tumefaciens TaxID=358 RepID=UPI0009B75138
MLIPEAIEAVIADFSTCSEPISTHMVQSALSSARTLLAEKTAIGGARADLVAFALQPQQSEYLPWHTFFGPMGSSKDKDGNLYYFPDPRDLSAEVVDHWQVRADNVTHPVLRARYADLVWDLSRKAAGRRADARFARLAIDSYFDSVIQGCHADDHDDIEALERALQLSCSIRDEARTASAKGLMIDRFHKEVSDDGWWLSLYEALTLNRRSGLSFGEKEEMVAGLEGLLLRFLAPDSRDPFGASRVANYLISYYSTQENLLRVSEIAIAVSEAYEMLASEGSPLQAMGWLQTAIDFARRANDTDRQTRLQVLREHAIRASGSEMRSFTTPIEFKKSDVEELTDYLHDEDWQQSLFNVAAYFIEPKSEVRHHTEEAAKAGPLMARMTMSIIANDHVAAEVGGEDDADGPLFRQADFLRQFNRLFLSQALDSVVERHRLSPEEIAVFIQRSDLFSDLPLVTSGIEAWLKGDYVKCLFVLVPQMEDAFRNLARCLGEPVTKAKPGRSGWEISKNLGDFMSMDSVRSEIGEDIHFWIRSIFADARGMNLRNTIAHAQAGRDIATYYACDTVVHSLLVIGAYKDIAVYCVRKTEARGRNASSLGNTR